MITVRAAANDDLDAVAHLAAKLVHLHHALDAARFLVTDRVEEGYRWWLAKELEEPQAVVLAAVDDADGAIVGYAYGRMQDRNYNDLLDRCGKLHDVWVEERARRRGVARELVNEVARRLESMGAPRVVLATASANEAAQKLFASLGFRRTMIEMTREAG
jgi:ribosomal protein S18 acetylase RimI-like enzyme